MRLLLICFLLSFGSIQAQEFTTIFLVRHAEKDMTESTNDPGLSEEGEQRKNDLAHTLGDTQIDAIFSTPYIRTRSTVAPLAREKGLEVREYDPFDEEALHKIIHQHRGKTILFSGHSNTVPAMLNMLTQSEDYQVLPDNAYDDLFMVIFYGSEGKVIHLQYSEEDH
ncbi:MAG: phosphoglycerate mutase family protein [Cyclobacteriaceae bacterium]